jgi:PPP family 3-phenylpropionic acid transporter
MPNSPRRRNGRSGSLDRTCSGHPLQAFGLDDAAKPLHGLTFALLHLAYMQMLSVVVPPALAATAQGIYGGIAVGTMTAIMILVSGPLYGVLGPRAFWVMALLCAAALPIAFAMRRISINPTGSNPI